MKMKDLTFDQVSPYFKDSNGNYSSTRLFSWMMIRFFKKLNYIFFSIMIILITAIFMFMSDPSGSWEVLGLIFLYWLINNIVLLVSIFIPKQLNKIVEIRGLVETMRPDLLGKINDDANEGEKQK